ncbi:MAG: hypothetical protein HQK99_02430 [Nitrospirae bacterium]|nr:hypothetical protein [Nitrospirota bacterium]
MDDLQEDRDATDASLLNNPAPEFKPAPPPRATTAYNEEPVLPPPIAPVSADSISGSHSGSQNSEFEQSTADGVIRDPALLAQLNGQTTTSQAATGNQTPGQPADGVIRDPQLLAQLNGTAPANPQKTDDGVIRDPALLAQLNGQTITSAAPPTAAGSNPVVDYAMSVYQALKDHPFKTIRGAPLTMPGAVIKGTGAAAEALLPDSVGKPINSYIKTLLPYTLAGHNLSGTATPEENQQYLKDAQETGAAAPYVTGFAHGFLNSYTPEAQTEKGTWTNAGQQAAGLAGMAANVAGMSSKAATVALEKLAPGVLEKILGSTAITLGAYGAQGAAPDFTSHVKNALWGAITGKLFSIGGAVANAAVGKLLPMAPEWLSKIIGTYALGTGAGLLEHADTFKERLRNALMGGPIFTAAHVVNPFNYMKEGKPSEGEGTTATTTEPPEGAAIDLQAGLDKMNALDEQSGLSQPPNEQTPEEQTQNEGQSSSSAPEGQQTPTTKPQTPEGKAEAEAAPESYAALKGLHYPDDEIVDMDAGRARDIIDNEIPYKPEPVNTANNAANKDAGETPPAPVTETVDWSTSKPDQQGAPADWPSLEEQLKALGYSNEEMDGMSLNDAKSIVESYEQPSAENGQNPDLPKQLEALGVNDNRFQDITKSNENEIKNPDIISDTSLMSKPDVKITRLDDRMFGNEVWKAKEDAKNWAMINLRGQSPVNKDTGWHIDISRKGIEESLSKSRSAHIDQIEAIRAIPDLIENAVLAETHPDKKGSADIINIHRFYAPIEIDGKLYRAKLTVRESADGKKFYDHSLTELEKPVGSYAKDIPEGNIPRTQQQAHTISVKDLLRDVKTSDGKSNDETSAEPAAEDQLKNPISNESGAVDVDKLAGMAGVDVDKLKEQAKVHLDEVVAAGKEIKGIFAPASMSEEAARVAGSLRERNALMDRKKDIAVTSSKKISAFFDRQPKEFNYQFEDDYELGKKQANPQLQEIADTYHKALDDRFDKVNKLDPNAQISYMKNCFPHLYKDPKKAARIIDDYFAKGRLEGSKSFFMPRKIPTLKFARELGLEQLSDNPNEMFLQRLFSMDKYIMAHEFMKEMKGKGLFQFIGALERVPADLKKVDDSLGEVWRINEQGELIRVGGYYGPKDAVNVLNNYLSPGLRGSKIFSVYLSAGNVLNQAQLGLSAWHAATSSVNAMLNQFSLGMEKVLGKGSVKEGLYDMATFLKAPFTDYAKGGELLKEFDNPSLSGEIRDIAKSLMAGGGAARQDIMYQTQMADKMTEAFKKGNAIEGLLRAPFALLEQFASPIFQHMVPRLKLGAFYQLALMELKRNPQLLEDGNREQLRDLMGKAWDSIDNRMGQVRYDNIFWNKVFKDLLMASVRSVGWTGGTIREIGGGLIDAGKAVKSIFYDKQKPTADMIVGLNRLILSPHRQSRRIRKPCANELSHIHERHDCLRQAPVYDHHE